MVYICESGSGCHFGKMVLCAYKDNGFVLMPVENDLDVLIKTTNEFFEDLEVTEDEVVFVSKSKALGKLFNHLQGTRKIGKNVKRRKSIDLVQSMADYELCNQLHKLGFSEEIEIKERNYKNFEKELLEYLFFKPELKKYLKEGMNKDKFLSEIEYKQNRLLNEFPHLYKTMICDL